MGLCSLPPIVRLPLIFLFVLGAVWALLVAPACNPTLAPATDAQPTPAPTPAANPTLTLAPTPTRPPTPPRTLTVFGKTVILKEFPGTSRGRSVAVEIPVTWVEMVQHDFDHQFKNPAGPGNVIIDALFDPDLTEWEGELVDDIRDEYIPSGAEEVNVRLVGPRALRLDYLLPDTPQEGHTVPGASTLTYNAAVGVEILVTYSFIITSPLYNADRAGGLIDRSFTSIAASE